MEEEDEMRSPTVVDPTPMTCGLSPGVLAVLQTAPEFPMEKRGTIPATLQASMEESYQLSPRPPPHELLIGFDCLDLLDSPFRLVVLLWYDGRVDCRQGHQEELRSPRQFLQWSYRIASRGLRELRR
jgi:hypothetical protein